MTKRNEEIRYELISQLTALIKEKFPNGNAKLITNFAQQYFINASPDDLAEHDVLSLYGALISHWNFIETREPGQSKIRVYNPEFEQHGWQSTHTIIEVVADHMAFLFESLRMVLNRRGLNIYLILQLSGFKIERDNQGKIISVPTGQQHEKNFVGETILFIEVDRQTDPQIVEELKTDLEGTIEDVSLAVKDWSVMSQEMTKVIAKLENRLPSSSKKDLDAELIEFLKWLNNNHFTYLGYCERKLISQPQGYDWEIIPDKCLGILRKHGEEYFESFQTLTKAAQELAVSSYPFILGKTDHISTVHRPTYTDFIIIKHFDENGNVTGEDHFIGLYTSAAYSLSPLHIPLLRLRVKRILERANVAADSHEGKTLIHILETLPRDDFFHATVEELYELAMGIFHLQERQRLRLFIHKDPFARLFSCLVYVPRERFNSKLREKMQNILLRELGGYQVDFSTQFSESILARIHFIVRFKDDLAKVYDVNQIQEKLVKVSRTWDDTFKEALLDHFGEALGNQLSNKYRGAFPIGYRSDINSQTAVYDVQHIERLSTKNPIEMSFYRPIDASHMLRFKLFSPQESITLSDIIPTLECMGLRVINERPHEIILKSGYKVWINDFGMIAPNDKELNVDAIKENFQEAFYHIWYQDTESDGFNRLVLRAGLNWREVTILRAYAKYLWQTGFPLSQAYIEDVLVNNTQITRDLIELFKARFDPVMAADARTAITDALRIKIKDSLEAIKNIDEDRIIRRYMDVILATIRTNFYQKDSEGNFKNYLSFKFDPSAIPELPQPKPMFEIFVYSMRVEGVHLRGAKVARGGIRWSDRKEDFRTEVLGLMKAQQVKNAVIVPLGAKGGFVPKQLAQKTTRDEIMNEAIDCYKIFIRGLLDLTDNLVEANVVSPQDMVRYDADDPYLVVAADKGTATFSDIANSISNEYNFWLGDAFASGGSSGYDHKKMAITARGGWESVKRHFREMEIDIQKTDFTVVGIGDMAGDVFGNGMLLSKHIKLIGAFNHIHIFLDPNPDPIKSLEERKRLFDLPRSSWEDYDANLISEGGGVFSRSSKFIPLSPEMQEILGIAVSKIVPSELIRALLKAPVDLIWNGGIGTYVKASYEHNINVGDRANDGLRVNGNELHAKVVGEGGNLGFTQLGRVEYALNGGKINTDAIDNSGGVNCSDFEVNIKILLNAVVANGDMTEKQRNQLLSDMQDEVAEMVIENNRGQIEAISVAEYNAASNVQMHCRLIDYLEKHANLDRSLEFLPSNDNLLIRQQNEQGLTRPEFAVLLAYSKTLLKYELLASEVPEDKYIEHNLVIAFPEELRNRFQKEMFNHRLKREIIAMQVSNTIVNDMGLGFIHRLQDETGARIPEIIRCYTAAREIFHAGKFREAVNALDFIVTSEIQTKMLHELNRLVRRGTRWFLRHRSAIQDIEEAIKHFGPKMQLVREGLKHALNGSEEEYLVEFANELVNENVPHETALITAQMSAMFSALDIVDAASEDELSVEALTITYYAIGARLELGWFREQIKTHPVANHWDALARSVLRDDLDRQQRNLAVAVMQAQRSISDIEAQIEAWVAQHKMFIDRWKHMIADLKATPKREFTMYAVALRELMELANMSSLENQSKKVA